MERTFISWTIENWITVFLMVALGYVVFALIMQFALPALGKGGGSQSSGSGGGNVVNFAQAA
jgi:hypothetical protein